MDEIKPITNQGFFSYVFKLSKFKQADLLNFIQYCMITIIPFILLYYFIKKYNFSISYKDSSYYILFVTFVSIMVFIVGIFFIDRIVNYIPPLSGKFYDVINITNISIALIMALLIIRSGYFERTSILLSRFDVFFDHMLSLIGIKNPPTFDILNHEKNEYPYQLAFYKARDSAIASGASNEKADEIGHMIVEKLRSIKAVQQTTDEKQILKLTSSADSSKSLGTSSPGENVKSGIPTMKGQTSTLMQPSQNISTSGISTTNPYARSNEGISAGMGMGSEMISEPEPAAFGGNYSSW